MAIQKLSAEKFIASLSERERQAIEAGEARVDECDCGCVGWIVLHDPPPQFRREPRPVGDDNPGDDDLLEAAKEALLMLAKIETLVDAWLPFLAKKYHAVRERLRAAIVKTTNRRIS